VQEGTLMAVAQLQLYKPRLLVELEGYDGFLPAVRFNSTFELNTIPTASVTIAVGREFRSWEASPVHALADRLAKERLGIRVLLSLRTDVDPVADRGHPFLGIPQGEFVIFDGFTGATGASSANGAAQFNIQMDHWLSDLTFSSVFSKTSHPGNPARYTFGALSGGEAGGAGGGPAAPEDRHWLGTTHAFKYFQPGNVETDLWRRAILPWFRDLCSQDAFAADELGLIGVGGNDLALAALSRMEGGDCALPLALDLNVDDDTGDAIAQACTYFTQDPGSHANYTIWDTLVAKFGAEFLFAVVPLVERALVVPMAPAYRQAYKVIVPAQGTQVEWVGTINRQLRGMGILATAEMITDPGLNAPGLDADLGIGGFYSPDPTGPGQIQIRQGPSWLTKFSASRHVDEAVGGAGKAIPDAAVPDVPPGAAGPDLAARLDKFRSFLRRYARYLYVLETLRGRQAVAAGPARFDIAPGSSILVYPVVGLTGDDKLKAPFYATVLRVSTHIDAEAAQIGTGFHLTFCRSVGENDDDRTSLPSHPLYRDTFAGCGLLG
jgi:hypothetical protein